MTDCDYCGCKVEAHDPVFAEHGDESFAFCNWGCLAAHVDEAVLATGTACNWEPA